MPKPPCGILSSGAAGHQPGSGRTATGNTLVTALPVSAWLLETGPESWVNRSRLNEQSILLRLSLSWAIWEGKKPQRGAEKPVLSGERAQPVHQAGGLVWIMNRKEQGQLSGQEHRSKLQLC